MHVWYVDAGIEDTPEPVYTHCLVLSCAIKKSAAAKITATFFWNLVPNSGLGQFCHESVVLSTKLVDGRAY